MGALIQLSSRPTSGAVRVGAGDVAPDQWEDPWENPWATANVQVVRESGDLQDDEKVVETLKYYEAMRPAWDAELAGQSRRIR